MDESLLALISSKGPYDNHKGPDRPKVLSFRTEQIAHACGLELAQASNRKHKNKHRSGSLIRGRRAKAWAPEGPKRPRREAPGPPHIPFLRDPPYIGISVISLGL